MKLDHNKLTSSSEMQSQLQMDQGNQTNLRQYVTKEYMTESVN